MRNTMTLAHKMVKRNDPLVSRFLRTYQDRLSIALKRAHSYINPKIRVHFFDLGKPDIHTQIYNITNDKLKKLARIHYPDAVRLSFSGLRRPEDIKSRFRSYAVYGKDDKFLGIISFNY